MRVAIPLGLIASASLALTARLAADHHQTPAGSREPLFEGIGPHIRCVTTSNAEAQRYFDQGLNLLFAYNHDEAARSLRQAAELDPSCAMAWWG